ncbi:MAG TPA: tetratricopeptide repeat protein [Ktedonobacterales bacterium]|nr:tetratricopeptide repeat protein [Ktedonobacterales bacterium]
MASKKPFSSDAQDLQITLLGGFHAQIGHRFIMEQAWRLRKAKSLVKLLALAPGHRLHREHIIDLLWPELEPAAALNNLHRVVHTIRQVLEPARGPTQPSAYLRLQDDVFALVSPSSLWIDVERFETGQRVARGAQDPAVYQAVLALYTGDLLPEDRYEEWASSKRDQLRQGYLALLTGLAHLYQERQEDQAAIDVLQRLVVEEPTLEEAHLRLMRLFAETGQRYQALRQYQYVRDALRRDLDAEPAAGTQQLYEEIHAGRFRVVRKLLPARSRDKAEPLPGANPQEALVSIPEASQSTLPHALTSFVGRVRETREIHRLLVQHRLVTLTGTGGSGKTRLALHAASGMTEAFADGIRFVEFAALTDSSLVPQAVAAALDIHEMAESPLLESLIETLRAKTLLLVLDNCEHLMDACAHLVQALLQACPHLHILATSRHALGLLGEAVWRVPVLACPDPDYLPPFEDLLRYDAVQLFQERACTRQPDFALTPDNALAVVQICRRLDGMPLAIELAAVRVNVLSVEQIAVRLDDALALLVTGSRAALRRQRTLRATYDWSYALLSERERVLFRRLSVFAGGWTLEAAEQVGTEPDLMALSSPTMDAAQEEPGTVLDLLAQLVDKSLVVMQERNGQARYALLETLRQYGAQHLAASGERLTMQRAHLAWCLALAEDSEVGLSGPEQMVWIERLEADHENVRAALRWALESGALLDALRLAGALWWFWSLCGYLSEGRRWLEQTLTAAEVRDETQSASLVGARAKALRGASVLAYEQADFDHAAQFAEASLACYRQLGNQDRRGMARALTNRGIVALKQRDYARAEAVLQECLALAREVGDAPLVGGVLNNLGVVAGDQGDYPRAIAFYQESLAHYRHLGDRDGSARACVNLGEMALLQGGFSSAAAFYREGLLLAHEVGSKELMAYGLEGAAGATAGPGDANAVLHAARLWGAAQVLRTALNAPLPPVDAINYDRLVATARAHCDPAAFARAWEEGQATPLEGAIAAALVAPVFDAGLPAGTTPPAAPAADALLPLTMREREVVALITAGCTNRTIAATLAISERTVEHHVARILAKLELASRAQVAVWAVKHLPLPESGQEQQ